MGLTYKPLFHLLVDKGMKGTDLTKEGIISAPTLTKLNKGEPVDGKVILRLCEYLKCQPGASWSMPRTLGRKYNPRHKLEDFTFRGFCVMFELIFEWDSEKEQNNFRDHGVHFDTAALAFYDYFRMERRDDDSSDKEARWQTMGFVDDVLFVVYAERGEVIRIISARVAGSFEKRIYHGSSEIQGWQRVNP